MEVIASGQVGAIVVFGDSITDGTQSTVDANSRWTNELTMRRASIFEPTPCDTLPNIAQIRVTEIARFMASGRYLRWPPEWRASASFSRAKRSSTG